MKFTDHIDLGDWNGQCLLTVRDYELFDFLENFFTDHDIETMVVHPPSDPQQFQLLFPPATSKATVHRLLVQVRAEELEHIVHINNGASGADGDA